MEDHGISFVAATFPILVLMMSVRRVVVRRLVMQRRVADKTNPHRQSEMTKPSGTPGLLTIPDRCASGNFHHKPFLSDFVARVLFSFAFDFGVVLRHTGVVDPCSTRTLIKELTPTFVCISL